MGPYRDRGCDTDLGVGRALAGDFGRLSASADERRDAITNWKLERAARGRVVGYSDVSDIGELLEATESKKAA